MFNELLGRWRTQNDDRVVPWLADCNARVIGLDEYGHAIFL
ncbi:hypothetical protein [Bifidobacterium animalis]|nr:hypothetical protein [Bifidobacterium animalis]